MFIVSGGFAEVRDNTVRIVTDTSPSSVSEHRCRAGRQEAAERARQAAHGASMQISNVRREARHVAGCAAR